MSMRTYRLSDHQLILLDLICSRDGSNERPHYSRTDLLRLMSERQAGIFKQTLDNSLNAMLSRDLIDSYHAQRRAANGADIEQRIFRPTQRGLERHQAALNGGRVEQARRALQARQRA